MTSASCPPYDSHDNCKEGEHSFRDFKLLVFCQASVGVFSMNFT